MYEGTHTLSSSEGKIRECEGCVLDWWHQWKYYQIHLPSLKDSTTQAFQWYPVLIPIRIIPEELLYLQNYGLRFLEICIHSVLTWSYYLANIETHSIRNIMTFVWMVKGIFLRVIFWMNHFILFLFWGVITDNGQGSFLVVHSAIFPGGVQETIWVLELNPSLLHAGQTPCPLCYCSSSWFYFQLPLDFRL